MRGAGRLFTLHMALAGLGLAALGAGVFVSLSAVSFSSPSSAALAGACRQWVPALGVGGLLLLAILFLAGVSAYRGLRSIAVDVSASRRYLRSLAVQGPNRAAEVPFVLVTAPEPLAFCAGFLSPRIYISTATIAQLDHSELRAVLAHEDHHRRQRDPLRILVGRALARSLFFLPLLRSSSERISALGELAADEAALCGAASRQALASALLKFAEAADVPAAGISPDRVDHLAGEGGSTAWRLSSSAMRASLAALGAFAGTLLVLAGSGAGHLGVPLLLAQSCMLAMTLGPTLLAGLLLLRLRRRSVASG